MIYHIYIFLHIYKGVYIYRYYIYIFIHIHFYIYTYVIYICDMYIYIYVYLYVWYIYIYGMWPSCCSHELWKVNFSDCSLTPLALKELCNVLPESLQELQWLGLQGFTGGGGRIIGAWWHVALEISSSVHMVVSWNRGTPQSSISMGFPFKNHPAIGGTPMMSGPPISAASLGSSRRFRPIGPTCNLQVTAASMQHVARVQDVKDLLHITSNWLIC